MKAVFEELNDDVGVFIVDGVRKIYHVGRELLPEDAEIGDVYEVEIEDEHLILGEKLADERKKRIRSAEAKRERLLNRKKNK